MLKTRGGVSLFTWVLRFWSLWGVVQESNFSVGFHQDLNKILTGFGWREYFKEALSLFSRKILPPKSEAQNNYLFFFDF